MIRLDWNSNDPRKHLGLDSDPVEGLFSRGPDSKCWSNPMKLTGIRIFVVCLMGLTVLLSISVILRDSSSKYNIWGGPNARAIQMKSSVGVEDESPQLNKVHEDKLLNGLLAAGFDEKSCLSRYQSVFYRKESPYKPSTYLISKLRSYEALHKRCGPYTHSYNKTIEQLKAGTKTNQTECNYIIWIAFSGLGNRIITLASAFLYALLTNRVLLVDGGVDIGDIFCEPFPEGSWLLPSDFPLTSQFNNFWQISSRSYGNMLKNNVKLHDNTTLSALYIYLVHDYSDEDKLFFCEQDQSFFSQVPWLIMKTNIYFVPSLFLIPSFEQELINLFPQKDMVFHLLGRYLFHPTNPVWGLITRYYHAYLAKADEKIGIQVRVFNAGPRPLQHVLDQILACTLNENLLPEINKNEPVTNLPRNPKTKAVLMTSLSNWYSEKVRDLYLENPTVTGDIIGIYQPSHEEYQQTEKHSHNRKAWAEMYLLSLMDKLVTSGWSTFGYVAQSLGGLTPWILYKPENQTAPNPACRRAMSMEPCFHYAPPFLDCKKKTRIDTGELVPHVRHCEDMSWGLKLVDRENL